MANETSRSQDFFAKLDRGTARPTVINWEREADSIRDSYLTYAEVYHAVQKDAIQNSWDARRDKRRGRGWSIVFELLKDQNGVLMLSITDRGTTGLTGRVLSPKDYELDLPEEERWGRFESLAFTHAPSEGMLGARGRGKFIFVVASRTRRIVYDTLRDDGVYRLGVRFIETTGSPVFSFEGEEAKNKLKEYSPSLDPLTEVSTRIIVDEPAQEVVDALTSGQFQRAIAETWFKLIEKYGAQIDVRVFSTEERIRKPAELSLPAEDNRWYQVWLKENNIITLYSSHYRIKRLHLVRNRRGAISESLRGVGLIRGGMKVMSIEMKYVTKDVADCVYGYIEFEADLEEELKRLEDPTHYSFNLSTGLGRKVSQYLEDQFAIFAREKLGLGDIRRVEQEVHHEAERRALIELNRLAKEAGLLGRAGLAGGTGRGRSGTIKESPVYIEMPTPVFPQEMHRVNYNESIDGITARAVNTLDERIKVRLSIYVLRGHDEQVLSLLTSDFDLEPDGSSPQTGPFSISFSAEDYPPDEYAIRAKLVCLDSARYRKGDELHKVSHRFWLELDPPERGMFEKVDGLGYTDEFITIDGEAVPGETGLGRWILQYNVNHPAKRYWDNTEENLFRYLLWIGVRELLYIDLRTDAPILFSKEDWQSPDLIMKKVSLLTGELMFRLYSTRR